jgi:hypothetical protein
MTILDDIERLAAEFQLMEFDCVEFVAQAKAEGDPHKAARWYAVRMMLAFVTERLHAELRPHWRNEGLSEWPTAG